MNVADKIYEMVKKLPEDQVNEVFDFVEFLSQKSRNKSESISRTRIAKGTLTGLRGIAKEQGKSMTDQEVRDDYTGYLSEKYQ